MEVNNFKQISSFIKYMRLSEGEFYFVQILIRGKDGHTEKGINGDNKNRLIKLYTIRSAEELLEKENEIISICKAVNARAYIHLTKRNFKQVADKVLELLPTVYLSNPMGLRNIYSSACGKSFVKNKFYLIDLDDDDVNKVDEIENFLSTCEPIDIENPKVITAIPTVHGKHLITYPFNVNKFKNRYPTINVHKNNPTLLYYFKSE